jgi:hypothetical protein
MLGEALYDGTDITPETSVKNFSSSKFVEQRLNGLQEKSVTGPDSKQPL